MNRDLKNDFLEDMEIIIPIDLEGMQGKTLPNPNEITGWKDYNARRIYINYEINPTILDSLAYFIQLWNKEDDEANLSPEERMPIKVYINTMGGDTIETLHCCDLMELSTTPVHTICQGKANSSGGYLLMAGHRRFAYKHSTFLIHSGSVGMGGRTDTVMDYAETIKKLNKKIKAFVISKTNLTAEVYDSHYRVEWTMDSDEMIECGIIDEIATSIL